MEKILRLKPGQCKNMGLLFIDKHGNYVWNNLTRVRANPNPKRFSGKTRVKIGG